MQDWRRSVTPLVEFRDQGAKFGGQSQSEYFTLLVVAYWLVYITE